ncbi:MAG: hypothetical protein ABSA34_03040 [Candidatus Goldiibacteriota bacterium]|jgi:hypothetical protein
MENISENGGPMQQAQPPAAGENSAAPKKKAPEFSITWHLKVLAVIYVILGVLYLVLKVTLK